MIELKLFKIPKVILFIKEIQTLLFIIDESQRNQTNQKKDELSFCIYGVNVQMSTTHLDPVFDFSRRYKNWGQEWRLPFPPQTALRFVSFFYPFWVHVFSLHHKH